MDTFSAGEKPEIKSLRERPTLGKEVDKTAERGAKGETEKLGEIFQPAPWEEEKREKRPERGKKKIPFRGEKKRSYGGTKTKKANKKSHLKKTFAHAKKKRHVERKKSPSIKEGQKGWREGWRDISTGGKRGGLPR